MNKIKRKKYIQKKQTTGDTSLQSNIRRHIVFINKQRIFSFSPNIFNCFLNLVLIFFVSTHAEQFRSNDGFTLRLHVIPSVSLS